MTAQRKIESNRRTDTEKQANPVRRQRPPATRITLRSVPNEAKFQLAQNESSQGLTSYFGGFSGSERTQTPRMDAVGRVERTPQDSAQR